MDRRHFLTVATATGISLSMRERLECKSDGFQEEKLFRTISYNVLALRGYPERSQNRNRLVMARPQMTRRLALELSLYQPDLITFQESPSKKKVAEIADLMGMNYAWFPGGFPGSVLSRYEISTSNNCPLANGENRPSDLFTRHWGRAVLKYGGQDLIVYTAHLHPSKQDVREREVNAMLDSMSADLENNANVILQGDLNMEPNNPLYKRWAGVGLQDAFVAKGSGDGLTISATDRRSRIDYIWSRGPLLKGLTDCRVLAEGNFIDHPSDKAGFALSDHLPVMATFVMS